MSVNAITAARAELAALLGPEVADLGAVAVEFVPEELPAPCVVVSDVDNPLEHAEDYGDQWWLTLSLFLLVDLVGNQQAGEDLDGLLAAVLPALASSSWELDGITKPGPFHTTQWLAHGTAITVRNLITL